MSIKIRCSLGLSLISSVVSLSMYVRTYTVPRVKTPLAVLLRVGRSEEVFDMFGWTCQATALNRAIATNRTQRVGVTVSGLVLWLLRNDTSRAQLEALLFHDIEVGLRPKITS